MRYRISMRTGRGFLFIALLCFVAFPNADATGCTVCHSKNPAMVRMHQELGFKDCFKCHYPGSKKSPEELKVQMNSDERCTNCHAKGTKEEENPSALKH
jgi:hypothetical protein